MEMVKSTNRGAQESKYIWWMDGWSPLRVGREPEKEEGCVHIPLSRAIKLRLNSLARIMGVQQRSVP